MTTSAHDVVQLTTRGPVEPGEVDYLRSKVEHVLRFARDPVLHVRARLTRLADPSLERPAVVQVNLDLNGHPLRVEAARPTMTEAVDEAHDRLRDRVVRAGGDWEAIRGTRPLDHSREWRHGSVPTPRQPYFDRPLEDRQVLRHKAYALSRATVDEAAFDMAMLDYDFHLFTEDGSGVDSVLYRDEDSDALRLAQVEPHPDQVTPGATPVVVSAQPAPRLTPREAAHRLEATRWRFVFFRDVASGRGCLLYHRYDGHYGLITPSG